MTMTREQSRAWHPEIEGWSDDILPWIERVAPTLPQMCHLVEVGCLYGRSIIYWGDALTRWGNPKATLHGYDPGNSDPAVPYEHADIVRAKLLANLERTAHERSCALFVYPEASPGAARLYPPRSLDGVFLDGDHRPAAVRADIPAWREKIRVGGFLAGHDYGADAWPAVKVVVDELIPHDELEIEGTVWSWRVR